MSLDSAHHGHHRRPVSRALALGLIALLGAALAPFTPAHAAPQRQGGPTRITILPINNARLLAGQRFDLRIEVGDNLADNTDPGTFAVTVDGRPLAQYFGKAPEKSNTTPNSAQLTLRQVSFSAPGRHSVSVNAGGVAKTVGYDVVKPTAGGPRAKNVVLMVGDGMAWQMLTIARTVSKGLTEGKFNGKLNMDQMDEVGYLSTSGYDSLVTDSANSASAYATGHKGPVNAMGVYGDDTRDPFDDPRVENIVELVKRTRNMATGLVVTAEIEDATPAAMFSHTRLRGEKQYIADQLLDDPARRIDVILGGGSAYFIPKSTAGSKRKDERNLLDDFRRAGYTTVGNRAELKAAGTPAKLLGLFHPGDLNVWIDREYTKDPAVLGPYTDQPSLPEMTQKALDILSSTSPGKQNGFFLLVEGSSIDKQLHPMDWQRATGDTIEFDKALGVVKAFAAKRNDTLIVVLADHGHSVSLYGTYDTTQGPGNLSAIGVYEQSKFPTFKDRGDGFPEDWNPSRTLAVGFGNHPAYRDDFFFNPRPASPTVRDPESKTDAYIPNPGRDPQGILYTSNLPAFEPVETHSADDVPVLSSGPGSRALHGFHDNTDVFFAMVGALGLDPTRGRTADTGTDTDGGALALGALLGLAVVIGAGRSLRRPGLGAPAARRRARLRRLGSALSAAARSFRETLRQD
jgi:alkaline phosphatase